MKRLTTTIATIFGLFLVMLLFTSEAEALDIDLEPVNFTFGPDYPVRGESLEIYFEVVNHGSEPASDVKIIVWNSTSECDSGDECLPIYETTESVIGNERIAVIDFSCSPDACGGAGDRVLTISADYDDDILETDEDNNKIIYEFTIFPQPLANLLPMGAEMNIMFTPENPAEGDSVDILILFDNNGRDSCTNFYIDFRQTLGDQSSSISNPQFGTIIGAGESAQFNITWRPDDIGEYTITIVLDSNNNVDEFVEDDNTFESTIEVRAHTPELTLDVIRNITVQPDDLWLDEIFDQHSVQLMVHILNDDYVMGAENIRVGFYDVPEGGTESLIGYGVISSMTNATRVGEEIVSATQLTSVIWDGSSGTEILGNHTIFVRIDPMNEISEWDETDNNFTFNLVVLESKPDIEIFDIFVVGQAVRGIPSDIIITAFNRGSADINNCEIEFRIDGDVIDSWNLNLNEGEFYNITGEYTWDEQQPSVGGYADSSKLIEELDDSNNVKSVLVNVAAPDYDLTLVSVDAVDTVFKGDNVEMVVQVRNNMAKIPSFVLLVYLDNSTSPEVQGYDFEGNGIYNVPQNNLAYDEIRFVTVFWKTTTLVGLHNLTIEAKITNSDFEDLNLTDNKLNLSIDVKARNFQLSVEMLYLPSQIYLNQTLEIPISALNFGPEICCECPLGVSFDNSSEECIGAEISLFIDGELVEIYQTSPLGRVIGEEIRVFYWKPTEPGTYYIEAVIDPDNIIDEFNELDNRVSAEITVSVEEVEIVEPEEKEEQESLINQPLIWIPLGVLTVAGIGAFVYSRLGDGGDYFDDYDTGTSSNAQIPSKQSGFRYDPVTGNTYDSQTGEIIQQGGKKKD
ncbi:MAG TPA: CARDB domain-containing protein [Candidatus Poseidoniia archaeon]|jgi:subtilase family serine protease|nr:CARDB domain-containing protein [Candidatus Poseidoniia archaeon]|tara:strand:- start:1748 stop:4306 length:2559 start_codon:yes stop_codon:yes gene_type:complete